MHKNIFFIFSIAFFGLTTTTHGASLKSEIDTLFTNSDLPYEQQSVCLATPQKNVLSYNADTRIVPASVSKLYTFDFALSTLPEDFRYTTTFILNNNTLYINGGGDPHFVTEHLTRILRHLYKEKGIMIKEIVFSPDFQFNWNDASSDVASSLTAVIKADSTLPVTPTLRITASSTVYTGTGTVYEFSSAPLPVLLKQINNYSTNISADTLFARLGGTDAFSTYMKKTYGVDSDTVRFETGSGLYGNYTTCELTLEVIEHLEHTLKSRGLALTDILSVPALDVGVLQNRTINTDLTNAVVAKSGFLNFHHSLAGVINTTKSSVYFAIFTHYDDLSKTSAIRNAVDTLTQTIIIDSYKKTLKSFGYLPSEKDTLSESLFMKRAVRTH